LHYTGRFLTSCLSVDADIAQLSQASPASDMQSADMTSTGTLGHQPAAAVQTIRPRDHANACCTPPSASGHEGVQASRVRTVLTENQLRVLRTCYAVCPRPDPVTRDQLIAMTGLASRVIRVWFQNRRCKDKKRSSVHRTHAFSAHDVISGH